MEDVGPIGHEGVFSPQDEVGIASLSGTEAGMRVIAHRDHAFDGDAVGEHAVEAVHQPFIDHLVRRGIEVQVIVRGMHAGIGATTTDHEQVRGMQRDPQRLFHFLLHTGCRRLALPSPVRCAVESEL